MNKQPYLVLVCDDSMLIRKKMKDALAGIEGLEVLEAVNGQEAVDLFAVHPIRLVFLDIVMPEKDGLEALQEIKSTQPDTVVIMATSVGTESNLKKALKAGADDFIQKPASPEEVQQMVAKYMNREEEHNV